MAEPLRAFGMLRGAAVGERVGALLTQVGLAAADGGKYPHEFSGGQRQRISIARALSSEPDFLVCDEPTSALDVSVQAQILNLMRELQGRLGLTYLFISHNLAVIRHMSDQLGVMYLGRIVEHGPGEAIFTQPRHPYTRLLLEAIPDLSAAGGPGAHPTPASAARCQARSRRPPAAPSTRAARWPTSAAGWSGRAIPPPVRWKWPATRSRKAAASSILPACASAPPRPEHGRWRPVGLAPLGRPRRPGAGRPVRG